MIHALNQWALQFKLEAITVGWHSKDLPLRTRATPRRAIVKNEAAAADALKIERLVGGT